ncbi:VWA domain-containing protein [Methanogenium marinum]|uniref:VWA domain-containing protein n=1 Tax=Methanogenium marinum TaxID=348610 RepID=A0A9Q4KSI5_9EURY|nr:VWA domain-containing protein [Methanogenium marinum]MDE4907849.1 VWA domain-containing protein [Methanogenium marinum]
MWNSLRILLVFGVIVGILPIAASAGPITDTDISIDFIIDDGNPADLHDNNGWLVAGSDITSTINVTYVGSGSPDIHFVRFTSVEKDTYGDVAGGYDTGAPYRAVFFASKNTAGNAPIKVQINYTADEIDYDYSLNISQPIDHNTPMKIQNIAFDSEVTLDTAMDITMTMEDAYGNTVTSLYEDATGGTPEGVTFTTTSYADSGFYDDGSGYDAGSVDVPVTADGSVVATFKTGTEAGPKYLIHIVPDEALNDKWLTITALADGAPYAITVSVDPNPNVDDPPYIQADGESKFYLTYNLFDQYGNPSGNQTVYFIDDIIGNAFTQRTNSDGQIMFSFGPFDWMGTYTIHAHAVENVSVAVDQVVRFTNTSPAEILLTANPQSMPSADVITATGADVLAKVTDESGNGVAGEEVTFFILPPISGYSSAQVDVPSLPEPSNAITDGDGIAMIHFTPGAFTTDISDVNYSETATDSCTVVAMWGGKTRKIDLEWKNYPYLRVETEVDPATVEVGDPVDVTIRLVGDGWALYPDPIDVMLCADRSTSMLDDSPSRMSSMKSALKVFNSEMTVRDQVGLASFGSDASVNLKFSDDRDVVNTAVDNLVANGGTSMRYGLYLAIKEFVGIQHTDAVRAVILLSDGDYNYYGDPLKRGSYTGFWTYDNRIYDYAWLGDDWRTDCIDYYKFNDASLSSAEQNMSVYAINHNVTIYSISFKDGISGNGKETLRILAESTGGKYYHAPTGDKLAAIYTDIAGELKTEAGVDTTMDILFQNIELNNVSQQNDPNDPILEYEYENGVSTLVKSWNTTGSEESPNVIGPKTLDQRDDWAANQSLNFEIDEIGTIRLGQTWQAVFRLNVSKPGNINIFGGGSSIFFNGGADSLALPKTYITAVDNLTATGIDFAGLQVYNLVCPEAEGGGAIENELTMNWNLNYSGTKTAMQYLYYQNQADGIWATFGNVTKEGPVSMVPYTRTLYVADFPSGEYKLRIRATAEDAPDSVIETPYTIVIGEGGQYFIRLE